MNRFVRSAGMGALAGAGATVPMTLFMLATKAAGPLGELPPRKVLHDSLRRFGVRPSKPSLAVATVGVHFAFGALLGAAMGVLREARVAGRNKRSAIKVSTAVWAGAYRAIAPTRGFLRWRARPRRPMALLAAHWVYGIAYDELIHRLR